MHAELLAGDEDEVVLVEPAGARAALADLDEALARAGGDGDAVDDARAVVARDLDLAGRAEALEDRLHGPLALGERVDGDDLRRLAPELEGEVAAEAVRVGLRRDRLDLRDAVGRGGRHDLQLVLELLDGPLDVVRRRPSHVEGRGGGNGDGAQQARLRARRHHRDGRHGDERRVLALKAELVGGRRGRERVDLDRLHLVGQVVGHDVAEAIRDFLELDARVVADEVAGVVDHDEAGVAVDELDAPGVAATPSPAATHRRGRAALSESIARRRVAPAPTLDGARAAPTSGRPSSPRRGRRRRSDAGDAGSRCISSASGNAHPRRAGIGTAARREAVRRGRGPDMSHRRC